MYRVRVGDYRILCGVIDDRLAVHLIRAGHPASMGLDDACRRGLAGFCNR